MIVDLQVTEFVNDYIVHAVNRHLDEVQVQKNVPGLSATSPPTGHFADHQSWLMIEWEAQARQDGGLATCTLRQQAGWGSTGDRLQWASETTREICSGYGPLSVLTPRTLEPLLARLKLQTSDYDHLLCLSCVEGRFVRLLQPVERHLANLYQAGQICWICSRERGVKDDPGPLGFAATDARERCSDCRTPLCASHQKPCSKCQQPICTSHETEYCAGCTPPKRVFGWFRR